MFEITAWFRIDIDWKGIRVCRNSVSRVPALDWAKVTKLIKRFVTQGLTVIRVDF
ncbi:MAG: hypothetical protein ACPL7O_06900 [Armatimonadota bacterium]